MSAPSNEWISGLRARQMLGIGYGALQRLAVLGQVRTLIKPGLSPRYSRADVEQLVQAEAENELDAVAC
jgi:hypothetical protein